METNYAHLTPLYKVSDSVRHYSGPPSIEADTAQANSDIPDSVMRSVEPAFNPRNYYSQMSDVPLQKKPKPTGRLAKMVPSSEGYSLHDSWFYR